MEQHPIRSSANGDAVPELLRAWLGAFRPHFTGPTWENLLVLIMGALLAPGKRTVSACLRMTGRAGAANFTIYHQVLNRGRWKGRALARTLLDLVVAALVPEGPVIIGVDDTIERRWGARIAARGIYRDPVRSSHGHFVKTSGLRWLSFMVLTPVPWAGRIKALPVLTLLAPSERANAKAGCRHKLITDWARQGMLQLCRWLPDRKIIFVGDASFAVHTIAQALARIPEGRATLISRLRLDASLFAPPPERHARTQGRPARKGPPLPKLSTLLADPVTRWQRITAPLWYGKQIEKLLEITSGTALWYRPGTPPRPIRWVLVRDPAGKRAPQAFLSTNTALEPAEIIAIFVRRWQVEVTFSEVRAHLGVETQRQWSDKAIRRTTPVLMGLYSLVVLWAEDFLQRGAAPYAAAWYLKSAFTFSDAIAAVRRRIWMGNINDTSPHDPDMRKIPPDRLSRMADALCFAA
jgi:DDE superfamily endonuclease